MRPQLNVGPVPQIRHRLEQRPGVQRGHRMTAQRVADHPDRLGQMRRAGRIQNHTAGPGQRDRGRQQFALQLGQRRHVGGLPSPARVGSAPQRAQTGARRVDQHPVETRLESAAAPVDPQHLDRQARGCSGRPGRRGVRRGSTAVTRAPDSAASAASSAVLPPGPAHRSSHRPPSSATGARVSARATNWLPSSWTSACPSRTAGSCAGSPAGRYTAYGEYRPTLPSTAAAKSSAVSTPGRAARCTCGRVVVGGQRRVEFPGGTAQRVDEGLRDPAGVGVHEGGMPDRVDGPVGRQLVDPGLLVAGADRAQHPVDETCSCRIEFDSRLLDRGRDGGVRVDAGAQQLVGAEPQQVEQYRVDACPATGRRPRR